MGKRQILTALLALVLAVSGGYLLWKQADYRQGAKDYDAAAETAGLTLPSPSAPAEAEPEPPEPYADLLQQVDLEALQAVNPEVVGWITIPETEVNYPLLQAADNRYYLDHTWMGDTSSVGAIFLECRCAPDFSGFHTIIYGHNMRNGSMFGSLRHYAGADYREAHPSVYLVTAGGVRRYDIFAAFEAGVEEIVYRLDLEETGSEAEFLRFSLDHSVIDTGIIPEPEDQIITLSTCTGRGHAKRWVVQAVLVPEL